MSLTDYNRVADWLDFEFIICTSVIGCFLVEPWMEGWMEQKLSKVFKNMCGAFANAPIANVTWPLGEINFIFSS